MVWKWTKQWFGESYRGGLCHDSLHFGCKKRKILFYAGNGTMLLVRGFVIINYCKDSIKMCLLIITKSESNCLQLTIGKKKSLFPNQTKIVARRHLLDILSLHYLVMILLLYVNMIVISDVLYLWCYSADARNQSYE